MEAYDLKDSGVDWIKKLPIKWRLRKLQYIVEVKDGTHDTPDYEESHVNNYPFVTSKDIHDNKINFNSTKFINKTFFESYSKRSNVCKGDIIMPMIGTLGNAAIVDTNKKFAIKNVALFKTSESQKVIMKYLFYFIESKVNQDQFYLLSKGGVQSFLSLTTLRNLRLITPALNEQKAIANYLDKACQSIDKTITLKQQQLDKLEAYRKSLIHEAVTKGLDKTVPMKDSGIEWLGKVPNHWSVSRLKNFGLGSMTNGLFKKKEFYGKGTKLVNVTDLYQKNNIINFSVLDRVECDSNEIKRYSVNEGDIFFVRSSLKMEGIGVSALVEKVEEDTVFECHIIRFKTNQLKANPKFILYQLNSMCVHGSIVSSSKTVTMTTISQDKIASIKLTRPDINEQKAIADYLDKACTNIDKTKETIIKQIKTLTQYRQSLIHECVTGKKRIYQGETQ